MKPSVVLERNREAIRKVVASHRARNVRVFGSVARGSDEDGSDLDLLVDTTAETTLMDIGAIKFELSSLLGVEVDVLTSGSLPDHIREQVLRESSLV